VHNSRVHKQLLKLLSFLYVQIKNGEIEINAKQFDMKSNLYVKTVFEYVYMVIYLSLNVDPEITKFFIEDKMPQKVKKRES